MVTETAQWTSPPNTESEFITWMNAMRAIDPVQRDPHGGWHIFGHAECVEALSNHGAFSNAVAKDVPEGSPMELFRTGNLSWIDPPRHPQLRALVRHAFTARYVAGLRPMVVSTIERFLGQIEGKEHFSFIDEYSSPIAEAVIANMLGIPDSDRILFGKWSAALMSLADPTVEQNVLRKIVGYTRDIKQYLAVLVRSRRRNPKDDFITRLTAAEVDGETLGDDEIMGLVTLLLLTGQTPTLTLANAVICLDQNPAADKLLRADPNLCGTALDEVLRYRAQTTRVARLTTRAVTLGRHELSEGDDVSVWLAAGNFDPAKFSDPLTFDPLRHPNPHVALGYGIHFCLGASLARMESSLAMEHLLRSTRGISVDHERSKLLDPRISFGATTLMVNATW